MVSNSLRTIASSRMRETASRRACRSPRLASVTSFSTIGRSSLAFGSVVTICSCSIGDAAMLANIAVRWLAVRLSLRPLFPWRMAVLPNSAGSRRAKNSVLVFEALGEVVDVVGRPVRHFHAEMQAHRRQHFLDLVQRLPAEVRGAEHLRLGLLDEVADIDDVVVLQAVRRTDGKLQLVDLLQQRRVEGELRRHFFDALLLRLLEGDEDRQLVL